MDRRFNPLCRGDSFHDEDDGENRVEKSEYDHGELKTIGQRMCQTIKGHQAFESDPRVHHVLRLTYLRMGLLTRYTRTRYQISLLWTAGNDIAAFDPPAASKWT